MTEFLVFAYAFLASFVIQSIARDRRHNRPSGQLMTMVGWGLFSLSSTLAVLFAALALALMLGLNLSATGLALPAS